MTSQPPTARSRRSVMTSAALVIILVVAAIALHKPLVAWFTGKSMGGTGTSVTTKAGAFSLKAALDPDPPTMKGSALVLEVHDGSGKPVDDAKIDVGYDMPAMAGMSEMKGRANVKHEKDGRYRAEFDLPMGGTWPLSVTVQSPSGSASQTFKLTVGSKGLSSGGDSGGGMPSMSGSAATSDAIDHYTCSMHPSVRQQGPGKCPICGMDLIPVTKAQQEEGVVTIDEARRQLIGVRTGRVIEGPMRDTFRAVGTVAYDESGLADVNLKVRGWITKLFVSETGQRVAKGQTLFTMYSPELYNAEQDFLLALHGATAPAAGSDSGTTRGESLGRAARLRLRLLGMDDAQIDAIAKTGAPQERIAIPSPASGFVIEKDVVEGASVEAGMRLYRIAALNRVWVEADVYEADLAHVHVGQKAHVTLDYLPGRTYDAKVAYVFPYLDSKARTGRVRVEIANKQLDLRPGMYANVELGSEMGNRVQVPAAAVVYTGPRRIVFIDLGEGRFKPQEIQVGTEASGMYEVTAGLEPGDLVATSGVFLIAAEARISTAAKYWESSTESDDGGIAPGGDAAAPAPSGDARPSPSPTMPTMPMRGMPLMPTPKTTSGTTRPTTPSTPSTSSNGASASPPPSGSNAPAPTVYSCPMHPDVRSATPGKCPKCGMDLRPIGGKP